MIHVLSLSGGKDSTAAALWLREQGIEHVRVFMDTGWEHPDLYAHLDYLEHLLGPIVRLSPTLPVLPIDVLPEVEAIEALVGASPSAFVRWCVKKGMFPSRMRRWCTQQLKVFPFLAWCEEQDDDIVNIVGIRAEESAARAGLPEREPMSGAAHVEVWRPLLRWTEQQVIDIHTRHGLRPCSLYLRGATRVGCWPCIMSNKSELEMLGRDDRRVEAIRRLEALASIMAARRDKPPVGMFQAPMPERSGDGTPSYPPWPIDRVLEWSRTARGGRQMRLGGFTQADAGCTRWGLCDLGTED